MTAAQFETYPIWTRATLCDPDDGPISLVRCPGGWGASWGGVYASEYLAQYRVTVEGAPCDA